MSSGSDAGHANKILPQSGLAAPTPWKDPPIFPTHRGPAIPLTRGLLLLNGINGIPSKRRASHLGGMEKQRQPNHRDDPRILGPSRSPHTGPSFCRKEEGRPRGQGSLVRDAESHLFIGTHSHPYLEQGARALSNRRRQRGSWEEDDLHPTSLSKVPGGLKRHSFKGFPRLRWGWDP